MLACYRCKNPLTHSKDAVSITTRRGDAVMPPQLRLCCECGSRLARWLHRRSVRPVPPPPETPAPRPVDSRPVRLATPHPAFLLPPR